MGRKMSKVFVDTAAFLALLNKSDALHEKAKELRNALREKKSSFVTTEQVIIEVANSLSKLRFRRAAAAFVDSILNSKDVRLVWTGKDIFQKAHDMHKKAADKE